MSPIAVKNANQMMASQKIAGSAESGKGVVLAGFYCTNGDVQDRLRAIETDQGPFTEIALHESDGWTFFIGSSEEPGVHRGGVLKMGHYRRESHKFFDDLPAWLFQSRAVHVHRLTLSQSNGFLSLTWLYSDEPRV